MPISLSSSLNDMFGRRRPLFASSQRSPPPTNLQFHREHHYPLRPELRTRKRITLILSYYIRRPVVLVILFCITIWLVGSYNQWRAGDMTEQTGLDDLRPYSTDAGVIPPVPSPTDNRLLTVTKTSTIRSTQTVTVERTTAGITNGKDAFGFPIVSSSPLPPPPSERVSSSSSHYYRPDGLLEVSPTGPHPIFELIKRADEAWDQKHKKASKTLKEAYIEYQRRYGRRPPKGFDIWWAYVQAHSVRLPDEYDQIDRDLAPFWGVDPVHLRKTQRDWEAHDDSFTVGKEEGGDIHVDVLNYTMMDDGVRQQQLHGIGMITDILRDVDRYLPPFRAVFSPHDNPNLASDYQLREEAKEAAKAGRYIDFSKQREHKLHGWRSGCSPFSPAWVDPVPYTPYPPPLSEIFQLKHKSPFANDAGRKTFIHDHRKSMDPCYHPSHLLSHGQFISHGTGPVPHRNLIPQFGYSPSLIHDDMMAALPFNWVEDVLPREDDPPFAQKQDARLHWRGRNTGMWHGGEEKVPWRDEKAGVQVPVEGERTDGKLWWLGQRGRLVDWANKMLEDIVPRPGSGGGAGRKRAEWGAEVESGIPVEMRPPKQELDSEDSMLASRSAAMYPKVRSSTARVMRSTPNELWAVGEASDEVAKSLWAPAMTDIGYAGDPINCEGRMCDRLREVYEFRKMHDGKTQGRYKFVMDMDGNGWSSRFQRLITSNALIFKSTIYPEWFTDRVAPWVHFVPIQMDLSDLLDCLYFFRGDPSGNNAHLDLAEKLARQGREWSLNYWRRPDMTAYTFRLFLEYARVMSEDRDEFVAVDADGDVESLVAESTGAAHGGGKRTITVMAKKQDYIYREEDEWVPENGDQPRPWDWRYREEDSEVGENAAD